MLPETPESAAGPEAVSVHSRASVFRTTQWSVIRKAQSGGLDEATECMEYLARTYWYPVYAFARRLGNREADAQDLTQGFLAEFVSGNRIHSVDASKGRFRSYLLTCFKNYVSDEHAKKSAAKRGGGLEFVPLDASGAEERYLSDPDKADGEELYDRDWAQSLISEVLERLRGECRRTRKEDRFELLVPFMVDDPSPDEERKIQNKLGLGESGFRSALQRLRFRFGEYLWTEIARTVTDVSEVEQEMRHVLSILSRTRI